MKHIFRLMTFLSLEEVEEEAEEEVEAATGQPRVSSLLLSCCVLIDRLISRLTFCASGEARLLPSSLSAAAHRSQSDSPSELHRHPPPPPTLPLRQSIPYKLGEH